MDGVEIALQTGSLVLDPQGFRVRIGHQHQPLVAVTKPQQELLRARQPADALAGRTLQCRHIEPQLAAPVIHAIPVQRALAGAKAWLQLLARLVGSKGARRAIHRGQVVPPEVGVEGEVEQRAIEVEQDGVDLIPVGRPLTVGKLLVMNLQQSRAVAGRYHTGRAARTWRALGRFAKLPARLRKGGQPASACRPRSALGETLRSRPSMAEIEDNVDRELFRNFEKLRNLRIEHRDLDEVIMRLSLDSNTDELQMKRLKKRKLMLKDQITRLESQLIPDLNA